jgi:hypothetical protein
LILADGRHFVFATVENDARGSHGTRNPVPGGRTTLGVFRNGGESRDPHSKHGTDRRTEAG